MVSRPTAGYRRYRNPQSLGWPSSVRNYGNCAGGDTLATAVPGHPCSALYDSRMPLPVPSPGAPAVVTGASHGIGEALATELAARGYSLIITARREEVLNDLASRLTGKYQVAVEVRPADLVDPTQREKLADELATRDISILCANAGNATVGPVAKLDPAGERALVQLNVAGAHDLVLAVLPRMIERKTGGILISGSAAGNSPIPHNATYASTKAFLNTFSESVRGELLGSGVHVTLLAPGPVRTGILESVDTSTAENLVPDYLWVSAEYAAKASLDALGRNKMRVVPGIPAKAMSVANQYLPRSIVTPIVGRTYKKLAGG